MRTIVWAALLCAAGCVDGPVVSGPVVNCEEQEVAIADAGYIINIPPQCESADDCEDVPMICRGKLACEEGTCVCALPYTIGILCDEGTKCPEQQCQKSGCVGGYCLNFKLDSGEPCLGVGGICTEDGCKAKSPRPGAKQSEDGAR